MNENSPIIILAEKLELSIHNFNNKNQEEQFELLSTYLNQLVQHDFNKLLTILYRIDVSEEKLKAALKNNADDNLSGPVIAKLLIQREQEKIKLRALFSKKNP